jgi:hypothetical protein
MGNYPSKSPLANIGVVLSKPRSSFCKPHVIANVQAVEVQDINMGGG